MAGNLEFIKSATSSSNADTMSITDCFTADYDVYKVVYVFEDDSGVANNTFVRFLDSSNALIADPFLLYQGTIDTFEISERGSDSNIIFIH